MAQDRNSRPDNTWVYDNYNPNAPGDCDGNRQDPVYYENTGADEDDYRGRVAGNANGERERDAFRSRTGGMMVREREGDVIRRRTGGILVEERDGEAFRSRGAGSIVGDREGELVRSRHTETGLRTVLGEREALYRGESRPLEEFREAQRVSTGRRLSQQEKASRRLTYSDAPSFMIRRSFLRANSPPRIEQDYFSDQRFVPSRKTLSQGVSTNYGCNCQPAKEPPHSDCKSRKCFPQDSQGVEISTMQDLAEPPLPPTPMKLGSTATQPDFQPGYSRRANEYAARLNEEEEGEKEDQILRNELYIESGLDRNKDPGRKSTTAHDLQAEPCCRAASHARRESISSRRQNIQTWSKDSTIPRDFSVLRKSFSRASTGVPAASNKTATILSPDTNTPEEKKELARTEDKTDFFRRRVKMTGRDSKSAFKNLSGYSHLKEEEANVERNNSVLLPVLEDIEKVFHDTVAAGDVDEVKAFLQDYPDFNINCVNYRKISALHVAVKQQNEAMIDFLLEQKDLDISDCALYAIKTGNIRIVEMILEKIREKSPGLEYAGTTHSVDFADDMTPLILAAQLGKWEMIDFLVKRDHFIPPVHPPFCKCDACKADLLKYDRLRYSTMKLNLYKAICNPMYIFHTTDDPFERAFELTKELQDAATVFPQFKVSFDGLCQSLRAFTVDLIGCCRNSQEVEIILKKSSKKVADHVKFPRLQHAIDLKQKEFVSHPYTQAVLSDAWTGDLLEWKVRSPLMQSLSVFPRIPMLPVMTIMCIFLPGHSLVRRWKTPVNKMISSVASYLIFLILLFIESNLDKSNQKRGPPDSGLEGIIFIFVIGYIWLSIRTCFKQGVRRYFSTMWHWYDTTMLFMFFMTMVFWIASWVDVIANNDVDLPRKYWNSMDPELIAEGFFAAAVIMAFFRLNLFLSLNYHLGPLQVSIGKMTLDIFRFIIIFFIIILAWCAGLCRFYQPYEGMIQKDSASGTTTTQVSSFVNFFMTLKTFFWAIFGMSPIESADVVIENLPGDSPDVTIINKHQFTETVGYIAFALFQFLSVVVVLNMLVACMANTFTKVIDNVTVEWVFGRSQIYLSFMASSVLPPPFNLVPTASGIKDMFMWFRLLAKPSECQRAKCSFAHCCYIESDTEAFVNNEFPSLMSELAQRYIRLKEDAREEEKKHEIDDIRNEVNDTKELLRKFISVTPQALMISPFIGRRGTFFATHPPPSTSSQA